MPLKKILLLLLLLIHLPLQAQDIPCAPDPGISPEEEALLQDLKAVKADPAAYNKALEERLGLNLSPSIRKKWAQYVTTTMTSDAESEKAIFLTAYQSYLQAIQAHGKRLAECRSYKIEGDAWVKDLQKEFGKGYPKSHAGEIGMTLLYLKENRSRACLEQERKNVLEAEAQYYAVLKSNLRSILRFGESDALSPAEKAQMQGRLRATKLYLDLLSKTSMATLLFDKEDLKISQRVQRLPKKLVDFLSAYPAFSKPFDLSFGDVHDLLTQNH